MLQLSPSFRQKLRIECAQVADGRMIHGLLLILLFWMTAAASFSGSLGKWGLREHEVGASIELMLDGAAAKPLIYRQLVPLIVNAADFMVPVNTQKVIIGEWRPNAVLVRATGFSVPRLTFRYTLICYIIFGSMFASLFLLRQIAIETGANAASSTIAAMGLVLAIPYLQTRGSYFYDAPELLFFSAVFLCALRGRYWWLIALILPATINKETFLFFIPALYPLLSARIPRRKAITVVGFALILALAVNFWDRIAFANAAPYVDVAAEHWTQYFALSTYTKIEITYGLRGPSGLYIGTCLATLAIFMRGWPECPSPIRQHIVIAAIINIGLVVCFSVVGELRNFSMIFVGLTILGSLGFDRGKIVGAHPTQSDKLGASTTL